MYVAQPPRAVSAAASIALTLAILALFTFAFGASRALGPVVTLTTIDLHETPPPPPPPRQRQRPVQRHARKAAPKDEPGERNLRNVATPIVAPPVVPLIPPPPIVAAPAADTGAAAQTGASDQAGPGRGAGRFGDGRGGGGNGGAGDGDGDGEAIRGPRQISGDMEFHDLPEGSIPLGEEAAVTVTFAVAADGRVGQCKVERSSGRPVVDRETCRLIEQRFRFRPAIDRRGRPVRSFVRETHSWIARPE
jgi:protein TonB